MIQFGHGTHAGLRRKLNEDTYYADPSSGLFLIADGMGGYGYGNVAAAMARDCVVQAVEQGLSLKQALRQADRDIVSYHQAMADKQPMGTTFAALHLGPHQFEAAWVGDSRIYLYHNELRPLTAQSSPVATENDTDDMVEDTESGACHEQLAAAQALGVTAADKLVIKTASMPLEAGTGFLLCSDGLSEEVAADRLAATMARRDLAAQEIVDHLLLMALNVGGHDNITAIVVRYQPG